jgi:hypothetical protein
LKTLKNGVQAGGICGDADDSRRFRTVWCFAYPAQSRKLLETGWFGRQVRFTDHQATISLGCFETLPIRSAMGYPAFFLSHRTGLACYDR